MKKRTALTVLAVACLAIIIGCGGGSKTPPPPKDVSVSVSPGPANVAIGDAQQFTATVSNSTNTAVTWHVNDVAGGNTNFGTISSSGLYTPPAAVPSPATVTIKAVAQADSSKSASVSVTILPRYGKHNLNGQYVVKSATWDGLAVSRMLGTFTADGLGSITNGVEDVVYDGTFYPQIPFTGTYTIDENGEGTATITSINGSTTLALVVVDKTSAYFIEYDSYANTTGVITKQDSTALSSAALNGNYVFGLHGTAYDPSYAAYYPLEAVGRFSADGAGHITSGSEDVNDGGLFSANLSVTGSYTVSSNGRGTATLNNGLVSTTFVFYIVDANNLQFLSTASDQQLSGGAEKQTGPFSQATLSGDFSFSSSGVTTLDIIGTVGRFTASGTGTLGSGLLDEDEGGYTSDAVPFSGAYNLASTGRATATVTTSSGTLNQVLWMIDSNHGVFLHSDNDRVVAGGIYKQQDTPFSPTTIQGSHLLAMSGYDLTTGNTIDTIGRVQADGSCNLVVHDRTNEERALSELSTTGICLLSNAGRGTASITNVSDYMRFYPLSRAGTLFLQSDVDVLAVGFTIRQY